MSKFFNCCVKCQRTFTDKTEYEKHMESHKKAIREKLTPAEIPAVPKKSVPEQSVLTDGEQEEKITAARELTTRKKQLIAMGIEAQTMKADEVNARYEAEMEKKKGK